MNSEHLIDARIHCLGIGGAGMAPLAELLAARGATVTGSDRAVTRQTGLLQGRGIAVQQGHEPAHVKDADMVVYSSAIREDNPERAWAAAHGIPQYRRARVVGDLMRRAYSVAVAGTHGKTTTTAMIGHLLAAGGMEPTVLGGGEFAGLMSNAQIGRSDLLVTEADEYDRSFLSMYPTVATVNNIEADHLDCYGTYDAIADAFVAFAARIPFYGHVIVCTDDPGVRAVLDRLPPSTLTCGTGDEARLRGTVVRMGSDGAEVRVHKDGAELGTYMLHAVGEHNVRNSLVAAAAALQCGMTFAQVAAAFPGFGGVKRRMEVIGRLADVTVIDDYAHHPTEIRATIEAARAMSFDRVVVVFQPHLYSRTRDFMEAFAASLGLADVVVVVDIYAAREEPIEGIDSQRIVERLRAAGHHEAQHVPSGRQVVDLLVPTLRAGDVVMLMGAGDINGIAGELLEGIAGAKTSRS